MPEPATTDLELAPGDKLIAGFFSLDGLSLALAETQYSLQEEVKTLTSIARDPSSKARDKIAASRQLRQIISDTARFSGLIAKTTANHLTQNPDGSITHESITQNRVLAHLSRARTPELGDHHIHPPILDAAPPPTSPGAVAERDIVATVPAIESPPAHPSEEVRTDSADAIPPGAPASVRVPDLGLAGPPLRTSVL